MSFAATISAGRRCRAARLLTGFLPLVSALSLSAGGKSPALSNLDLARQLNQAFVHVAEQVSPSVVVITVMQRAAAGGGVLEGNDDGSDPFDRLPPELRDYFRRSHEGLARPSVGQGSGVIIREDGYILTNAHVVEDAEHIEVRLRDGRSFKAKVRGVDAPSDIAVIKIDARGLPIAKLADSSKIRVGEFAIAIGAPFALDYSVTFGHVSAKDRSGVLGPGQGLMEQDFIQTDANINPGNSGGPLVNIEGEVIGINSLIRGYHTGIGFAVPVNLAREVSDKLISEGKFTRAWLGIGINGLREEAKFRDLIPGLQDGVVVTMILPEGPLARSDLTPSDIITAVDGRPVATAQQLKDEIRAKKVGRNVVLDVFRPTGEKTGKRIKVTVQPGEYREVAAAAEAKSAAPLESGGENDLGLKVKALTTDLATQLGVELTAGVIVSSVERDGLADHSDIKPGDIITSLNHQPVANPREFRELLRKANLKKGVMLNLISEGTARFEVLKNADH